MNLIKQFLKEIRTNWEVNVLCKRPRKKIGRYAKRRKVQWK